MWLEPLREVRTVWQPIYELHTGAVWGYEALARGPAGSPWENPAELLDLAKFQRSEGELEEAMRRSALRGAVRDLPDGATLFVNVDPRCVGVPANPAGEPWPVERTILEISERSPLFDQPEALQAQIAAWRAQGYRVALDDYGAGYAGAAALLAVRPDVIKLDIRLVSGVDKDAWQQAVILAIVSVANSLDIAVIAEGIETAAEREQLMELGVTLGQGFLLGRPASEPAPGDLLEASSAAEVRDILAAAMPASGAAYAVDTSRRIVHWNRQAALLSGRLPDDVAGKTCWLSGLDHRDAFGSRLCFYACPLVNAMQTGEPRTAIVSMNTASGERRWIVTRVEAVRDRNGRVVGAVERFAPSRSPQTLAEAELGQTGS